MKAQNLLPQKQTITPRYKPRQHAWEEDQASVEYRARMAERKFKARMAEVVARQHEADLMHAIGYAEHMAKNIVLACGSVGCDPAWIQERSTLGHLKRGEGRTAKRGEVFRILRARGYSYPEIALAFRISHSSVIQAVKNLDTGLTRPNNGA